MRFAAPVFFGAAFSFDIPYKIIYNEFIIIDKEAHSLSEGALLMQNNYQQYGGYPQAPQGNQAAPVYCANCGTLMPQGSVYCPNCGHANAPANAAPNHANTYGGAPTYANPAPVYDPYNPNPAQQPNMPPVGEVVSKSDYLKKYSSQAFRQGIKTSAIIGYVLCGIVALTVFVTPLALVDLAIYLGLTLGVHLAKNKICAFGILGYGILGCVLGLIMSGSFTGWGWIALGGYLISLFNKEEKAYNAYMASRQY